MIFFVIFWNLFNWFFVGVMFNIYIMRKYKFWWFCYIYVMVGVFDVGNVICFVFFVLGFGFLSSNFFIWWGIIVVDEMFDVMRMVCVR